MTTFSKAYELSEKYISSVKETLKTKDPNQDMLSNTLTRLKIVVRNMFELIKKANSSANTKLRNEIQVMEESIRIGKESIRIKEESIRFEEEALKIVEEATTLSSELDKDKVLNEDNLSTLLRLLQKTKQAIDKSNLLRKILIPSEEDSQEYLTKVGGYKKRKSNRKHKHKWSLKYKRSIDCKHPKGFSQRQHCKYGRKTMRKLTRKK